MAKKAEAAAGEAAAPAERVSVQIEGDVAVVSVRVPVKDLRERAAIERTLHPAKLVVADFNRGAIERSIVRLNTSRKLLDLTEPELARHPQATLFPASNADAIVAQK